MFSRPTRISVTRGHKHVMKTYGNRLTGVFGLQGFNILNAAKDNFSQLKKH